ncbi:ATP-dependent DNA helicase [Mycolicibacterium fortuitum]|uniref:ATP-dependent helicase DinG n=1 Tax=Mycolicibacterium fortuitum subsp. fortuitum DSM 46621 = ATCC 6841 = JCM 6387 TaxID=1214102 RepID=K0VUM0_MYCFO|nr:ATP-dependent DNA helicase [Mycolicibacterium fortuitum]CRL82170.1 helicase [Mycolicibacter nonchromogenicus]EJZ15059.1 helicase [Mycolicibacterium fortuitum subsp. fortuitum DSM 46621 = ATCC 6841 = JCM 6387]WEV31196.1 ATP-dependent DNA helicase [Mycolicibacterium fortuitum]CRL53684.1 helicase [Mycolicibacterium fortuitum subsp. fortuitum DSM 46621 = ATCC 6841 = JCM 6387]BDE00177.1 helicase [Mycolicibacterium fortuitum subsp. fortuitum]
MTTKSKPSREVANVVTNLLKIAVKGLGGASRPGQVEMAEAVAHAFESGEHLAVQAGTGTGKSLAYLVPSIARALQTEQPVVVSTATIALQRQLVDRDLPRLVNSLADALPRKPTFALLKGRGNYLCLNKIHNGAADEPADRPQDELFSPMAISAMGRDVQRLTEWSSDTETGDRDELTPGVPDRSWSQVSVSARECIGVSRCQFGTDCFAERAREKAGAADVVVTNHALLAIDALSDFSVLPEYELLVVDEAHELADRVTGVATAELSATSMAVAHRRMSRLVDDELAQRFEAAVATLSSLLHELDAGRIDVLDEELGTYLTALRDAANAARTAIDATPSDPQAASARTEAVTALSDVSDTATRILTSFVPPIPDRVDVVWVAREESANATRVIMRVAPMSVSGLLRTRLFANTTAVLTSATLTLGGNFDAMARNWGLGGFSEDGESAKPGWRGLDVGSPFDHAKSAILYVAKHLPPPGRDGTDTRTLDEIEGLITAAGGRTLGLFSSMRAAKAAAEVMRERLSTPVLCQGEDTTSALVQKFSDDPETSLFGTLSLWQGVDVPGQSLSLVLIDRIPFPRPDDPLLTARQRAISAHGGNGFMAIAANHAALLLAQGTGRLLRHTDDRGVIAVLDSRLATARYGGYLRSSLPPFWSTTDPDRVRQSLKRLRGAG